AVILLLYFIGKSIFISTRLEVDMMKDISQGEGDLTRKLNASGNDEISELSRSFNLFALKMRELLVHVAHSSNDVSEHAQT
ncbi:methyl-accepting chemotaxis protein, partial [Pseudoalteromonas sp. SIMBA_148]